MRALFYHEGLAWSGRARAFTAAARGLAARGWHVAFACPTESATADQLRQGTVDVVPLPARATWLGDGERLRTVLRERQFDVVFVHSEHEQLAAATAVWRASRGVVIRRVGAGETFTLGRSARAALRMAPTVALCTWPEQATLPNDVGPLPTIVADLGVDADAVASAPAVTPESLDAVDELGDADSGDDLLEYDGEPEDDEPRHAVVRNRRHERRLVCVCAPETRSRAAVVLRAAAMLAPRHRGLRVLLVGPGAKDEQLRMHAAALGIHRLVHHAHGPADEALARAGAHVGWVAVDGDDGAFGALDFMAAGVPVLTDHGTVAARYVSDGITGLHLTPGEVPGTAAALAALLARDDERVAIGSAGRARVARIYGETAMIDGFARAASTALERSRSRR